MNTLFKYLYMPLFVAAYSLISCGEDPAGNEDPSKDDPTEDPTEEYISNEDRYPTLKSDYITRAHEIAQERAKELGVTSSDIIPDFSRIGYRYGDKEIPAVAEVVIVTPPADGADATATINAAIASAAAKGGGAVLLKDGEYFVDGVISMKYGKVVLRGESREGTIIWATGSSEDPKFEVNNCDYKPYLIAMGGGSTRSVDTNVAATMLDDYAPCGQFWLRVSNADSFKRGDEVVIHRPSTQKWIADLLMNQIPYYEGRELSQWSEGGYDIYTERVVTMVKGDTLHFENPIVMSMDKNYGGGAVYKYSYKNRIRECGIENLTLRSQYYFGAMCPELKREVNFGYTGTAIVVNDAEHCWIKDVKSEYFSVGLVSLNNYSKNISVLDCESRTPYSILIGGLRYGFTFKMSQLSLVKNCLAEDMRHSYASGARGAGPNAFVNCTVIKTTGDKVDNTGPHERWNSATLYDNVETGSSIIVEDRSHLGTGQGWAAANNVVWNCTAGNITVQTPWVSAFNYSIMNHGTKVKSSLRLDRPDGIWVTADNCGTTEEVGSLYERQLSYRREYQPGGVFSVK